MKKSERDCKGLIFYAIFLNRERKVRYMKKMDKIKVFLTAVCSFLSSMLGVLFIPVVLLVSCNVIDYITGLIATQSREEKVSSYKSIRGIAKRYACGYWLLWVRLSTS